MPARIWTLALLAAVLVCACGEAFAQQSTTATYFDWTLQCVSEGTPSRKVCGIYQTTQVQGKNVTFSRIGIEGSGVQPQTKLLAQFPVNVSLREPLTISFGSSTLSSPFDRCLPVGCFAEVVVKDDVLRKWKDSEGVAKVMFKNAGGGTVTVPLSFKGLRSALEALAKE